MYNVYANRLVYMEKKFTCVEKSLYKGSEEFL